MALVSRFTRLFTADVHAVLDRLEEPDVLLKQAIREMESEVQKQELGLRQLIQTQDTVRQRQETIRNQVSELNEQLDLCFASNQEDLAKSLLRRRLPCERQAKTLETRYSTVQQQIRQSHELLATQRQRLAEVREKASYVCDQASAGTDTSVPSVEASVSDEDIEIAFLKEKQLRSGT